MTTQSITLATGGQKNQIARLASEAAAALLEELGLTKEVAQRLLGKGGDFKTDLARAIKPIVQRLALAPNVLMVPDMAAVDLTALANQELNLTYLDSDYERWDYYRGVDGSIIQGRGKKFEVLVVPKAEIEPSDGNVSSEKVRDFFRERGYFGHAGAFTEWRRTCGLQGYHASILEDKACWRGSYGYLSVPYSVFDDERRGLLRHWLADDWDGRWSFVGFREIA